MARERKMCTICGRLYLPTSNNQKLCPDCREGRTEYSTAGAPGPVNRFTLNEEPTTEDDEPWEPDPEELKPDSVKPTELPDQLQMVDEMSEILRKYYRGELIDRQAAREEILEEIREKLNSL